MHLGCYDFCGEFRGKAQLPLYKGSTLRGAFGVALKKVFCALKHAECKSCELRRGCFYVRVFEDDPGVSVQNGKSILHPFVIEPPNDVRTEYDPGSCMEFRFLLFGSYNEQLPCFIYAFQQIAGLGRLVEGKRSRFELKTVYSNGDLLFDSGDEIIHPGRPENLNLESFQDVTPTISTVRLNFQTPLRLKFQNQFKNDLPFHVLIRAALRRISGLEACYGDGEPDLDYKGLVNRSYNVRTMESRLSWLDWDRYSNRQDTHMQMGGLLGEITYSGDCTEFAPLLKYCEKVHIGKATTFGLGRFSLEVV